MSLEIIQQFEERQKKLEQRLEEQRLLIEHLQNDLRRQVGHALTHAHAPQGIQYATTDSVEHGQIEREQDVFQSCYRGI